MIRNEAPGLIAKKIVYNLVLLAVLSGLFILSTKAIEGGDIGAPAMVVVAIVFLALTFDVVIFALRNPTNELFISYSDSRTEERLDAILNVMGYRPKDRNGDTIVYAPSFWIGGSNGKVRLQFTRNQVVVTGPQFALHRMAQRLWLFQYPDISFSWEDQAQERRYAQTSAEYEEVAQMAPFGANTGYEPTTGTAAGR